MMQRILVSLLLLLLPAMLPAQEPYHGDGPDDVLRLVPVAGVYALKACGVESASSWKRLAVNSATSLALTAGVTWALKQTIHERRPDWTDRHAFPSGHAALAFAGATLLYHEYRHTSLWIPAAGYALATGVAIDRVARNRHRWQDVAAGAAIGVGSTALGYWLGDLVTGEHSRYAVAVGANQLSLTIVF